MKIKIQNFSKENLIERKKIIDELINLNIEDMEFNENNLEKAKDIIEKYTRATTDNWNYKSAKILVANSKDEIIATVL